MNIRKLFIQNQESFFNLLMGLYMACIVLFPDFYDRWFRDPILDRSDMAIRQSGTSFRFGVMILVLQVFEFIGLKWKSAAIFHRHTTVSMTTNAGIGVFVLWIFHSAVSILLGITAFQAFGLSFDKDENWSLALILVIVLKELFLLAFLIDFRDIKPAVPLWKETSADIFLFVFNAVAYITIWESIAFDPKSSLILLRNNPAIQWIEGFAAILLFCMTILPLKIPWLTGLWYSKSFDRKTAAACMSLLSIVVVALSPLFIGQHDFQKALKDPDRTTRLYLIQFPERTLPEEIEQLYRLQVLFAEKGKLEALPPSIGELKELRYLNLQSNDLKALPREIGELESLRTLVLQRNQLASLPVEVKQLLNLRTLDLSRNRFKQIPSAILSLPHLREIKLTGNPLPREEIESLRKKMPYTKITF
jgi:hypothetical protein